MALPLLALVLAADPGPGVFFHVEGATLWRAEVMVGAAEGHSGAMPARVLSHRPVRLPGLVMGLDVAGAEAIAVVCPRTLERTDAAHGCPLFHVRSDGSARRLGVQGLWGGLVDGERLLFLRGDLTLVARPVRGGEDEVLARNVLEPRLSVDRQRVGLAHVPGLTAFEPGFDACAAVLDLATRALVREPGPCAAQAPFLGPDGASLKVSTASGIASLFSRDRRLSGHSEADFVPVPGSELVWLDGRRALYSARYERDELLLLDVERGAARMVGPGHALALVRDGAGREGLFAYDGRAVVELNREGL
jgi:hypothetical protein